MSMNPTLEKFVADQLALFWGYVIDNALECVAEDEQQVIDDLIEQLRIIAMDSYLACKARELALSLYAGFPVDLGCVMPSNEPASD